MAEVTLRELRDNEVQILDRVTRGETLTVTRDGWAVAELRPLPARAVPAASLLQRWRRLPAVDPARLRADVGAAWDTPANPPDLDR